MLAPMSPEMPWEMIARSQRAAVGLMADTVTSLVEMGKAGVTRPEEVVAQVTALASAVGDLAGSTARPLEFFLESQRQLAETMSAFAVLQRQLADVLETAATNHAAIVQALEMMTQPVITVAQRVRADVGGDPDEAATTSEPSAKKSGSKPSTKKSRRRSSRPSSHRSPGLPGAGAGARRSDVGATRRGGHSSSAMRSEPFLSMSFSVTSSGDVVEPSTRW